MDKKYKYAGYFMMVLIPLVALAFYKTYFINFPNFNSRIRVYDHIHAILASLWVLTLITQPILIRNRKYELHRKIGRLSYILFPLLILSFIPREIVVLNSDSKANLFFPVGDSLILISLYLLAIYNKKNTQFHMRYFIASALVLLGPIIGRIGPIWLGFSGMMTQNIQYALIHSILIALIIYDQSFKKSRPYIVALALFLLHQITFYFIFS
ncbi:MAG: hypothetical protein IPH18_17655 [Chitinophagaceae bacterium]|nr:hypothetical protein [Chitinophagaceae bacterium]